MIFFCLITWIVLIGTSFNQSEARIWRKLQNYTLATNQKPWFLRENSKSSGRTCTWRLLSSEKSSLTRKLKPNIFPAVGKQKNETQSKGKLETADENLWLGPKLTITEKSAILALSLWNLVIIGYSCVSHIDQVS